MTDKTVQLTQITVDLGKTRSGSKNRSGFKDPAGQIYLPPKTEKRVTAWRNRMMDKGFSF